MNKSICFAYFADGKWIGWYGGTFGGVSPNPKVYSDLEHMRPVIQKNLTSKIAKINTSSLDAEIGTLTGIPAISLFGFCSEDLLRGKEIELRVVECPEYDGPNQDFDSDKYQIEIEEHSKLWTAYQAEHNIPDYPSLERKEGHNVFLASHPFPKCNNWIYCDYAKVIEWAKYEPTEFIETITP